MALFFELFKKSQNWLSLGATSVFLKKVQFTDKGEGAFTSNLVTTTK